MIPVFLDMWNLLKYKVAYKIIDTAISASMVYCMDPDSISTYASGPVPLRIALKNQGNPKDSRIFMVLAPIEFETPIVPSPRIKNYINVYLFIIFYLYLIIYL